MAGPWSLSFQQQPWRSFSPQHLGCRYAHPIWGWWHGALPARVTPKHPKPIHTPVWEISCSPVSPQGQPLSPPGHTAPVGRDEPLRALRADASLGGLQCHAAKRGGDHSVPPNPPASLPACCQPRVLAHQGSELCVTPGCPKAARHSLSPGCDGDSLVSARGFWGCRPHRVCHEGHAARRGQPLDPGGKAEGGARRRTHTLLRWSCSSLRRARNRTGTRRRRRRGRRPREGRHGTAGPRRAHRAPPSRSPTPKEKQSHGLTCFLVRVFPVRSLM